jgi:hypothetical protein
VRREEPSEVDVSRGEAVEHELNRLIEKRHDQRVASEERRRIEDGWAESTVRYNAQRRRELRTAWRAYHEDRAAGLRRTLEALIWHHETEAAKLQVEDEPEKETA